MAKNTRIWPSIMTTSTDQGHESRMHAFQQLPKAQQLILLKGLGLEGPHKAKAFNPEEARQFEAAHRMWDWFVQQGSES